MALHPIVKKLRADVRAVEKELKGLAKEIKQEGEDFKDDGKRVCTQFRAQHYRRDFKRNTTLSILTLSTLTRAI
ncbi:hypothetical protein [Vibrio phage J14]|nr:hypothetical protein [Vibrio phage J14]